MTADLLSSILVVEKNRRTISCGRISRGECSHEEQERALVTDGKGLATILEGTIREIVRQEVKAALAEFVPAGGLVAAEPRWMTPPQAARKTGVPVKAIRNMIKEGAIETRLRNIARDPTQPKYLVNIDEVAALASRERPDTVGAAATIQEKARLILADRQSRR